MELWARSPTFPPLTNLINWSIIMKYFIEGRLKGTIEQKRYSKKTEQEYTFHYVILESEQNITLIKQIQYNPEKFQIDDSMIGSTVLCPVYIDNVFKDGKFYENIKLIDEIKVV